MACTETSESESVSVSIQRQIGTGGSAIVYRGVLSSSGEPVAVKVIKKDFSTEKSHRTYTRAKHESAVMAKLHHKNICPFMGEVETNDHLCLVLQYAPNGDLLDRLNSQGALPEKEARRIFRQILRAVRYLHGRGIVHRDLKPENVLFDERGDVMLVDFGFAMPWSPIKSVSEYVGTLNYAAPEIVTHTPYIGPELDMWSLGALLLAMLSANIPFDAPSDKLIARKITKAEYELSKDLSPSLKDLLGRLLQPNPLKRATMVDLYSHPWMLEDGWRKTKAFHCQQNRMSGALER